jgi:hypothetical protein
MTGSQAIRHSSKGLLPMRPLIFMACVYGCGALPVPMVFGQAPNDDEREFQATVARLLDAKTVFNESQRLSIPYRRAAHAVRVAFDRHKEHGSHRDPLGLIEATRMLRVVECSRHLAQYVDAMSPGIFEAGPLAAYPAAHVLIEFGSVSYSGIFYQLERKTSEKQLQIFALVCLKIDGKKLSIARLQQRLDEYLADADFPGIEDDFAKNLRRLSEIIRTVDFSKTENWP